MMALFHNHIMGKLQTEPFAFVSWSYFAINSLFLVLSFCFYEIGRLNWVTLNFISTLKLPFSI